MMNNYTKAINDYKEQAESKLFSMSQGELLAFVYDEGIRRIKRARLAFEANNMQMFQLEISRAVEIVFYLDSTLDYNQPISAQLHKLYEYITYELNRVTVVKNFDQATNVINMLKELKDTFVAADEINKKKN